MQVNNSELFNPAGIATPATQERPGDGLFDALLRDEEARYEKAPPAADRGDGYLAENDRREPDDPYRDNVRAERDRADGYEEHEHRDDEPRAGSEDHSEDVRPDPEHGDGAPHDEQTDDGPEPNADWADSSPTVNTGSQQQATGDNSGSTAALGAAAGNTANAPAVPGVVNTGDKGATGSSSQTASAAAQTPAAQGETGAGSAATSAANTTQSAAPATSPDNTTAAGKPATVAGNAEKASPPSAAAQTASSQAATAVNQKSGNPTGQTDNSGLPEEARVTTVKADNAGLTSRPSAALGGAAATAALAEEAKTASTKPAGDDKKPGKATPGSNSGLEAQKAQGDTTTKSARPTDAGQMANSNNAAKAGGDVVAGGTGGSASAGSAPGSLQAPTTTPGVNAMSGGSVQNTSFAEAMNTARGGNAQAPAEQVAVQIQKAAAAGKDQINIKLHPAELGRIEVKLESGNDGVIRAVISAERSETLDLLQRDARGLERALQDAGVKTDSGSLNFNLKGQQHADQERPEGQAQSQVAGEAGDLTDDPQNLAASQQPAQSHHDGALDIRV